MKTASKNELGELLRQERVKIPLTLQQLSNMSGVSPSHLGRTERGDRFPSAGVLRKIAKPLGFEEDELFTLAGYLSPQADTISDTQRNYGEGRLDPYVAKMLAQEPVEVQLSVIGILGMLKSIAKGVARKEDD